MSEEKISFDQYKLLDRALREIGEDDDYYVGITSDLWTVRFKGLLILTLSTYWCELSKDMSYHFEVFNGFTHQQVQELLELGWIIASEAEDKELEIYEEIKNLTFRKKKLDTI